MNILLVDNYDSFTYNLLHILKELSADSDKITVVKNDEVDLRTISKYDKIILSPGPGIPSEAGYLTQLIKGYAATSSILGVCLGFHAIGEVFGAKLVNTTEICHGVKSKINILKQVYIFEDLTETIEGGRYHSWIIDECDFPDSLEITATTPEGVIMAISHKEYDLHGVQFHPESILTPCGKTIIRNFLFH